MFAKKSISNIKTDIIFLFTQLAGSLGYILQSLAIALVPIAYLVIVNSFSSKISMKELASSLKSAAYTPIFSPNCAEVL